MTTRFGSPFPVPAFRRLPFSRSRFPQMKLVECVPNFSEGRRPEIVDAIRAAIASVESVHVLDVSSDASHNRSVITFVASVEHAADAAFAGIATARDLIDLTTHQGEHPRLGATDVVPFIPLEGDHGRLHRARPPSWRSRGP